MKKTKLKVLFLFLTHCASLQLVYAKETVYDSQLFEAEVALINDNQQVSSSDALEEYVTQKLDKINDLKDTLMSSISLEQATNKIPDGQEIFDRVLAPITQAVEQRVNDSVEAVTLQIEQAGDNLKSVLLQEFEVSGNFTSSESLFSINNDTNNTFDQVVEIFKRPLKEGHQGGLTKQMTSRVEHATEVIASDISKTLEFKNEISFD